MIGPDNWPLEGLCIIDLSTEIAGPYCSKMFVDGGASVVKVESPDGDPLRHWRASGEPVPEGKDGALFQYLNASKQSIVLDLNDNEDRQVLLELVKTVDIVMEDFGPGGLQKFGLDYKIFTDTNPAVSLISISDWGLTGPDANRPSTEFTLQAANGGTNSRGLYEPGRRPQSAGGRIGEWAVGCAAAVAAMTSWLSAKQTGLGQHADLSSFEAQILITTIYPDLYGLWGDKPMGRTIEVPSIEKAKDGSVGFCLITGQQWLDFCALIGRQDLADDPKYTLHRGRTDGIVKQAIEDWIKDKTVDEVIELATLLRVPACPIGNGETVLKMDQMIERNMYVDNPHGFKQPKTDYRMGKTAQRAVGEAPRLNQHREQILDELKLGCEKPNRQIDPGSEQDLPLKGLRVVDLTAFWAGPYASNLLAKFGADVIKVESIHRPDAMRFAGGLPKDEQMWEWAQVFACANRGKRDITLSLNKPEGVEVLHKLIADADVVIENFTPAVMDNFGLTDEVIHDINPRAIFVRMPAFGIEGPWRDRRGFAMNVEQVSGLAWVTGFEDIPITVRGACDPMGGIHAFFALMLALEDRNKTGEGQLVEVPLVESALSVAAEQVIDFTAYGDLLDRQENKTKQFAPQGVYACVGEDHWIALSVENDEQWQQLYALMAADGMAAPLAELNCQNLAARTKHHPQIDQALDQWFASKDIKQIEASLLASGIPAEELVDGYGVMPNRQLEHRGFYETLSHPVTGKTRYPTEPVKYSRFDKIFPDILPPLLGEHNQQVLGGELGLSDAQLSELREKQIIGEKPSFM